MSTSATQLLRAAVEAMPKTIGDRQKIIGLNELMSVVIKCRMSFLPREAEQLESLSYRTCVGVFRPIDINWYSLACHCGGTYPKMYEKYTGLKPWYAPALIDREYYEKARIAVGVGVLIDEPDADQDQDKHRYADKQLWWCTSLNQQKDTITLCRYRIDDTNPYPLWREGKPIKRKTLTRQKWREFFGREARS